MITDKYAKDLAFVLGIPLLIGSAYHFSNKYFRFRQIPQVSQQEKYACIELGGTSIRLAIGVKETQSDGKTTCKIIEGQVKSIQTSDPETNIQEIREFFSKQNVDKVGIASFGPICLDETSETYGYITTTPKLAWKDFPIVQRVAKAIPQRAISKIGFDTDVNAAALAEFTFGSHKTKKSLAYITVGTGVGVGLIIDGKCVHGLTHPEGGHVLVQPFPEESFGGICLRHKNCVEGLVSNYAIAARLNKNINELADITDEDPVWDITGFYLAQLCLSLTLLCSPEVIVIGGGIMNRQSVLEHVRTHFKKLMNGYVDHQRLSTGINDYIVKPFFADSGLLGSMVV